MIIPYNVLALPLDQLRDTPAAAAYGLRRLKSGYKGAPIRVRRSNDNAEMDIPFCGQDLCVSTLLAFVTTNSGFITTWYDQSGNGLNATQATAANQPRIVNAGVVDITDKNKPMVTFLGAGPAHRMSIANNSLLNLQYPFMISTVMYPTSASSGQYVFCRNNSSLATLQYATLYDGTALESNIYLEGASRHATTGDRFPLNASTIHTAVVESGNQQGYYNGNLSGNAGTYSGALTDRSNTQIAARSNDAGGTAFAAYYGGGICEIIIFNATTGKQKLEINQGKYYSIGVA